MDQIGVARLYLKQHGDGAVVVNIPGTNYQLHLRSSGEVSPSAQGRVRGVVRLPVWKVDVITAGGAFIEPVYGRPRRVQGQVVGSLPETNSLVVEVCDQPIVCDLPARWSAADFAHGSRVGLDIKEGGTFEPLRGPKSQELGANHAPEVNLLVG